MSISAGELRAESKVLDRDFYARPAVEVARDCLGEMLLQEKPAGWAAGCQITGLSTLPYSNFKNVIGETLKCFPSRTACWLLMRRLPERISETWLFCPITPQRSFAD